MARATGNADGEWDAWPSGVQAKIPVVVVHDSDYQGYVADQFATKRTLSLSMALARAKKDKTHAMPGTVVPTHASPAPRSQTIVGPNGVERAVAVTRHPQRRDRVFIDGEEYHVGAGVKRHQVKQALAAAASRGEQTVAIKSDGRSKFAGEDRYQMARKVVRRVVPTPVAPTILGRPGSYTLYRAAETHSKAVPERGLFLAPTPDEVKWYGPHIARYRVNVMNPVVSTRQSDLYHEWLGDERFAYAPYARGGGSRNWGNLPDSIKTHGSLDNQKWQREIDRRLVIEAKRRGYDAIIYTAPAAPAKQEVVILHPEAVVSIEPVPS